MNGDVALDTNTDKSSAQLQHGKVKNPNRKKEKKKSKKDGKVKIQGGRESKETNGHGAREVSEDFANNNADDVPN